MKLKKARNYIADSLVLHWLSSEVLLKENQAQNKLEYHEILFLYAFELVKQREISPIDSFFNVHFPIDFKGG